jgi:hypothetical protein
MLVTALAVGGYVFWIAVMLVYLIGSTKDGR